MFDYFEAGNQHRDAVAMANTTSFGLTGGVFSRSPGRLTALRRLGMSGIGSEAGGPDYLLQFVDPVTVCDNTMPRGFAPEGKD